ncbi:ABC-2 type transporter [Acidimicrobium ferrooxidans DSM 10331]|uniref:ABC-2 type transporter n=1 Tax=Acidimicrobium ferrooxidans (strain DSM 10331 / JCM 15462 / NBRC 103882 / ICP) TaxID=525909 RepID=C7M263_ACIFD|nr:ABC transporter permease [Acidimicrobium ferrooxidans]ACU53161.1 ABC-2 type transporter [Acidimicrobium ferrooxidans DSM 10331]
MSAHPVRAQAVSELKLVLRQGEAALLTIVIPILGLVLFSKVKVLPVPGGISRVNFILNGAITFGIMASGMVSQSITVAFDRSYGVLKRLGMTPLGRSGVIAAKLVAVAGLEIVELVLLLVVGAVLGWHPAGNPIEFVVGWVLATAAFAGVGLVLGGTLRAELVLGLSTLLWLVLLGLGAMVVPLGSLPGPVADIAKVLPAAPAATVLLHGIAVGGSAPLWAWVSLVAWAVVAPVAASRLFRWSA